MKTSKNRLPQAPNRSLPSPNLSTSIANALEREVTLWNQSGEEDEELMKALDILAIAHIAAFDELGALFRER
jgi:hypothetical protein